jgi:hypothetical protein
MWIERERAGDMQRFYLCFAPGDPNPEDRHVRAYLRTNELEPKRIWPDAPSGAACDALQFGECYLGEHLRAIEVMRARGVVTEAVGGWLRSPHAPREQVTGLDGATARDLAWDLAGVAMAKDAVRSSGDGAARVLLDVDVLSAELPGAMARIAGAADPVSGRSRPA